MLHHFRLRSRRSSRSLYRGFPLRCEFLEGRLAPGDVLLSSALFQWGPAAEWAASEPRPTAELPTAQLSAPSTDIQAPLAQAVATPLGDARTSSTSIQVTLPLVTKERDRFDAIALTAAASALDLSNPDPPTIQTDYFLMEWTIPTPDSQPHDIISDEDGILWFTEIAPSANKIGRFDPFKEEFLEFDLPTPNAGPHGIFPAPDGGIWFTEQRGNKIGRIDRYSFEITEYDLPNLNSGPHTPIYDGYGHILFTEQSGNRIGRLDMKNGKIEEWALRAGAGPYGIVPDADGNAWFCEFGGSSNRIGKLDFSTGEITEYGTPTLNSGPRRLWFDSQGILWITLNRSHMLASFNPATEEFTEWPTPHAGGQPYAITVDQNDMVWYTEFAANYMIRYDPANDEFTSLEMPTTREQVRFIHVDPFNRVWYENNGNSAIGVVFEV